MSQSIIRVLLLEDSLECREAFQKRFQEIQDANSDVHVELTIVGTAYSCEYHINLACILHRPFDFIFLDHDLDQETCVSITDENTGSHVATWVAKNIDHIRSNGDLPTIIIHTLNSAGAEYMISQLRSAEELRVVYIPGVWSADLFHRLVEIR